MSLKSKLIIMLNENQEKFLSGEAIADELGVSRTAIWKIINNLKEDGYEIETVKKKGYRLLENNDLLNSDMILNSLTNKDSFRIECVDRISSTNIALKQRINEDEGLVIVANHQENGIGRMNRQFFSPKDTGVYFSILLKPQFESSKTIFITTMAAVAVCNAIKSVTGIEASIKWVNDIYINGKKIAGILTQGSFSIENNKAEYIILGIGLNIYMPEGGFPSDIENRAASLLSIKSGGIRNKLVAEIINEFWKIYLKPNYEEVARKYKELSFVIGQEVQVISVNEDRVAKVLDIDENCNLIVEFNDGDIQKLSSGEIQIKISNVIANI